MNKNLLMIWYHSYQITFCNLKFHSFTVSWRVKYQWLRKQDSCERVTFTRSKVNQALKIGFEVNLTWYLSQTYFTRCKILASVLSQIRFFITKCTLVINEIWKDYEKKNKGKMKSRYDSLSARPSLWSVMTKKFTYDSYLPSFKCHTSIT